MNIQVLDHQIATWKGLVPDHLTFYPTSRSLRSHGLALTPFISKAL